MRGTSNEHSGKFAKRWQTRTDRQTGLQSADLRSTQAIGLIGLPSHHIRSRRAFTPSSRLLIPTVACTRRFHSLRSHNRCQLTRTRFARAPDRAICYPCVLYDVVDEGCYNKCRSTEPWPSFLLVSLVSSRLLMSSFLCTPSGTLSLTCTSSRPPPFVLRPSLPAVVRQREAGAARRGASANPPPPPAASGPVTSSRYSPDSARASVRPATRCPRSVASPPCLEA